MKTRKLLCCVCIGMLMTSLTGCSDDDEAADYFKTEWLQCAPGCFVMQFEGFDTINTKAITNSLGSDVIAIATFMQVPEYDNSYHYPPMGNLYFNPSELPDEEFIPGSLFVCSIKEVRTIKMEGPYHDAKCIGKVKPCHSDQSLYEVQGTIQRGQYHPDTWTIVYEKNGRRFLLIPLYLDDALKEEGRHVTFSGELFDYTNMWYIDDPDVPEERFENVQRIRLTSISAASE